MQDTSALYRQILATEPHWFETSIVVGESGVLVTEYADRILFGGTAIIVSRDSPDTGYTEERLMSVRTSIQMFNDGVQIGRAISQEIEVTMIKPAGDFPDMAQVVPYVRVCNETDKSEWIQQGVFYIDTREFSDNDSGLVTLTFHGYDAMLMAEQYYSSSSLSYPAVDTAVVREIANKIGVTVDSRTWTIMTDNYTYPLPSSYSLREMLEYIAGSYAGCFIMTETGQLRLVTLLELPAETNYLIDHIGDAITFGIDREGSEVTVDGGAIASFETEGVCDISELTATIEPQQSGTGDPSPENERPISGWTGLIGKKRGKNLLSGDYFINSSGTAYTLGQSVAYTTRELYLKANVNYTLQVDGNSRFTLYIRNTNNSSTRISNYATSHNVTVTVEKDGLYALYCYKSSSYGTFTSKDDINWWQLEVGLTATAVERYRAGTFFVSWQDEAGTVFGANVDVVSGVLTVDRAKLVLDENIPSGSSGFRNITELEDGVRAEYYPYRATGRTDSVIISDKFKSGAISTGVPFVVGTSASNPRMYVTLPLEYNTEAKIRAWFSDNPTEFVYYLAQPQTYQLTPQQLTTFAEQNNIYVDTGSIEEVKYLIPTSEVTRILV